MENRKFWLLTTLSSFVATVLGIVVTFGVSKVADLNNARNMQKQCVFSAITDIDNAIDDLKRDSAFLYAFYPWLPDYVDKYSHGTAFSCDTACAYFMGIPKYETVFIRRSHPVGSSIMNESAPSNEYDMQLHRTIAQAYVFEGMIIDFQNSLYDYLDAYVKLSIRLGYSRTMYSHEDYVSAFLGDEKIQQLAFFVRYNDENRTIDNFMSALRQIRRRILNYSDVSEEEYDEFLRNVKEKEKLEEVKKN